MRARLFLDVQSRAGEVVLENSNRFEIILLFQDNFKVNIIKTRRFLQHKWVLIHWLWDEMEFLKAENACDLQGP